MQITDEDLKLNPRLAGLVNKALGKRTEPIISSTFSIESDATLLNEYQECVLLTDWLEEMRMIGKIRDYTHIPNETYTTSWNQKRKNKAQGVKSGFPDYIILTNTRLIVVEMKRQKKSSTSEEQKVWLKHFTDLGIPNAVCKGFEEARAFIAPFLV